jgi:diguanylate cyclase (GGDEF)-like protein
LIKKQNKDTINLEETRDLFFKNNNMPDKPRGPREVGEHPPAFVDSNTEEITSKELESFRDTPTEPYPIDWDRNRAEDGTKRSALTRKKTTPMGIVEDENTQSVPHYTTPEKRKSVDTAETIIRLYDVININQEDIDDENGHFDKEEIIEIYKKDVAPGTLRRTLFHFRAEGVSIQIAPETTEVDFTVLEGTPSPRSAEVRMEELREDFENIIQRHLNLTKEIDIQDCKKRIESQNKAYIDELTGVQNRAGLEKTFPREVDKLLALEKEEEPKGMGVLFIDIDHFKKFNDKHKQQGGDEAIKQLAQYLDKNTRDTDTVCRLGGEEMVIILNNITQEELKTKTEELHKKMKPLHIDLGNDKSEEITVSIGATFLSAEDASKETTNADILKKVIRESNSAEAHSKVNGRDQITYFFEMTKEDEAYVKTFDDFEKEYLNNLNREDNERSMEGLTDQTTNRRKRLYEKWKAIKKEEISMEYEMYLVNKTDVIYRQMAELSERVEKGSVTRDQAPKEMEHLQRIYDEIQERLGKLEG